MKQLKVELTGPDGWEMSMTMNADANRDRLSEAFEMFLDGAGLFATSASSSEVDTQTIGRAIRQWHPAPSGATPAERVRLSADGCGVSYSGSPMNYQYKVGGNLLNVVFGTTQPTKPPTIKPAVQTAVQAHLDRLLANPSQISK